MNVYLNVFFASLWRALIKSADRRALSRATLSKIILRTALRVRESAAKFINARLAYHYRLNQLIVAYNYAAYYIPLSHLNAPAHFCEQ